MDKLEYGKGINCFYKPTVIIRYNRSELNRVLVNPDVRRNGRTVYIQQTMPLSPSAANGSFIIGGTKSISPLDWC